MDGSDALCYARTRRNSSDLDRITRQQRIMLAVLEKASALKLLAEPQNMVSLWKSYKSTVKTDLSDIQIPGFARLAAGMDPDDLAFLSLGPATVPYTTSEGASVLLPSEAGIEEIVRALYSNANLEQENAIIEIQNGTDRQGFAQSVIQFLTDNRGGLSGDDLSATNAALSTYAKTEIIDFSGKTYTAGWLASRLEIKKTQVRPATPEDAAIRTIPNADIVVILGSDAKIDASAVANP
jgi:hypothetical protein